MRYQVFLAGDWVEIKDGEILDSPWGTKALLYELFDGSGGYTLHWKSIDEAAKPETPGLDTELYLPKKKTASRYVLTVRSLSLGLLRLGEGLGSLFNLSAHDASLRTRN